MLSGSTARGAVVPLVSGRFANLYRGAMLGRKRMISGSKFDGFCGWKVGKLGEMLDPLETKQIHGSNPTKPHQTNKSQKKIGAIFGGEFSKLGKNTQN